MADMRVSPKRLDLKGQRFGKLIVKELAEGKDKRGQVLWICECDCGGIRIAETPRLRNGTITNCGCKNGHFTEDLEGKVFGKLKVICKSDFIDKDNRRYWECACECGNYHRLSGTALLGGTQSCGCISKLHLEGQKFGRLTVLHKSDKSDKTGSNRSYKWICECECGKIKSISGNSLSMGLVNSCGCLHLNTDLIGKKFNMLTVLRVTDQRYSEGSAFYECQCDCGGVILATSVSLQNDLVKSCGCLRVYSDRIEKIWRDLYIRFVAKAKLLKRDTDLTYEEYIDLAIQPCHYCGIQNSLTREDRQYTKGSPLISDTKVYYNGIDRVDSSKGYSKGNMVACCYSCNTAKLDNTDEEFRIWLDRISKYYCGSPILINCTNTENTTWLL